MALVSVLEKLETSFMKLQSSNSKSLLKKYLTRDIFDNLKKKTTPSHGSSLYDVIQSGIENPDSGVGIYAPDPEAYKVFAELFDPVINDYHGGFKPTEKQAAKLWGDLAKLGDLDPTGKYIISTRVRCGRSIQGFPFNACLSENQYKEIEKQVVAALGTFEGELQGQYHPLKGMSNEVQQRLIDNHFLFKEGDRFLKAAKAHRYWPNGRGIFHNKQKNFLVWCNEEDHLRIISMQPGGNLGAVYGRLITAVDHMEKKVAFARDERLGYLTFCPSNLGTSIRASVHIRVPNMTANVAHLEEAATHFNLQVRGSRGEHSEAVDGLFDVSNKRRLGVTEFQVVKEMRDGIMELIKIEQSMEKSK